MLDCLMRIQELPGDEHPIERLAEFLRMGDYEAASIGACDLHEVPGGPISGGESMFPSVLPMVEPELPSAGKPPVSTGLLSCMSSTGEFAAW
jgi:hypothetical protein